MHTAIASSCLDAVRHILRARTRLRCVQQAADADADAESRAAETHPVHAGQLSVDQAASGRWLMSRYFGWILLHSQLYPITPDCAHRCAGAEPGVRLRGAVVRGAQQPVHQPARPPRDPGTEGQVPAAAADRRAFASAASVPLIETLALMSLCDCPHKQSRNEQQDAASQIRTHIFCWKDDG